MKLNPVELLQDVLRRDVDRPVDAAPRANRSASSAAGASRTDSISYVRACDQALEEEPPLGDEEALRYEARHDRRRAGTARAWDPRAR